MLLIALTAILSLTVHTEEIGIVVEKVHDPSAPHKAKVLPGDTFTSWELKPVTGLHDGAKGDFESIFHWDAFLIEQVPRGDVKLFGTRNGATQVIDIPMGDWYGIVVRPVLPSEILSRYLKGKALIDEEKIDQGIKTWESTLGMTSLKDRKDLVTWLHLKIVKERASQKAWEAALESLEKAKEYAEDPLSQIAVSEISAISYQLQSKFQKSREAFSELADRWKNLRGEGLGYAYSMNRVAVPARILGDFETAETILETTREIREKLAPGSLSLSDSLNSLGSLALYQQRLESAANYFQRTLEISEKLAPGSLKLSRLYSNLGLIAKSKEDFESSRINYDRALKIQEKIAPRSSSITISLNNLGALALDLDDFKEAQKYFLRVLEIQEKTASGGISLARTHKNLGLTASESGDFESADTYLNQALSVESKIIPGTITLAETLNMLGNLALKRGYLDRAEIYFKQVFEIRNKKIPGTILVADALNNLGAVARKRGDWDSTNDYWRRALEIKAREAPDSLSMAESLNNLGSLENDRNEFESAISYHKRAMAIREKLIPNSIGLAHSFNNIGNVENDRGNVETARIYYKQALNIIQKAAPNSIHITRALENMSSVTTEMGNFKKAKDYLIQALDIRKKLVPGSEEEARSHYMLAKTLGKMNEPSQALFHYEQAILKLESQLGRLGGSNLDKTRFQGQQKMYYQKYIELLMTQNQRTDAFEVSERARARVLHLMISERDLVLSGADIPSDLEKKRKIAAFQYDKTQQALADAHADREQTKALQVELRERRRDYNAVIKEIRKLSPGLANLHAPQPLGLTEIQKKLDDETLLLSYSVHEDRTFLFVVGKSHKLQVRTIEKSETWLRDKINAITMNLKDVGNENAFTFFQEDSKALYDLLIKPASQPLAKAKRLLIIPDGPLFSLPFNALMNGNRYLIADKSILKHVSATLFFEQQALPKRGTNQLTAFGDPVYPQEPKERFFESIFVSMTRGQSLNPLPGTRKEVSTIASLFGNKTKTFLGEEATEEQAKSLNDNPGILHFACHAFIDKQFPLNSSLALTTNLDFQEGEDNGFLQAWEIMESMRLNSDLVVLSACETGLGKEVGTEGLVGLTRAFQFAGARTIAASYWKITDETTALFMERFYTHLKNGMRKDEALRKAQIEFIEGQVSLKRGLFSGKGPDIVHPYYWAAFQLHGPGD